MHPLWKIIKFIYHHPLAGKHKIIAYYRFIYWQLTQYLFPHDTVVKFVGNTRLIVKKGLSGATGNIYTGLHEFEDMGFLLHFLRKEDLFFDVGANIGSYTILSSGCIGARSVSFEPVPSTFNWLLKNISANHLNGIVHAKNIGLGSKPGVLHFTKSYDTVNHVVIDPVQIVDKMLIEVQVYDFDSITEKEGVPLLVKIDVEGFESEVLKGMSKSFKSEKMKAIIIELNGSGSRYGFNETLLHEQFLANNFLPYQYDPFKRKLKPLEIFGSQNTIYIRDIEFVKTRLESADKISVFSEIF